MEELALLEKFESDSKWFFNNYNKLKPEFKNKFVLIRNKKVEESAKTMDTLVKKAEKREIDVSISVIEFVSSKDVTIII